MMVKQRCELFGDHTNISTEFHIELLYQLIYTICGFFYYFLSFLLLFFQSNFNSFYDLKMCD